MSWSEKSKSMKAMIIYSVVIGISFIVSAVLSVVGIIQRWDGLAVGFILIGTAFLAGALALPWIFAGLFKYLNERNHFLASKIISVLGFLGILTWIMIALYDFAASGIEQILNYIVLGFFAILIAFLFFFAISYIKAKA